jgi:hypothetical protein
MSEAIPQSEIRIQQSLNSAPLGRATTVVRNRRGVANRDYPDSSIGDRANRRLASTARAFDSNFALLHARFVRLLRGLKRRLLCSEGSTLTGASKPSRTGRRLSDEITLQIGNRNHRVVEGSRHVRDTHRHIFLFLLAKNFFLSGCFCHGEIQISDFRFGREAKLFTSCLGLSSWR